MTARPGWRAPRIALAAVLVAALVPGLAGCSSTSAQSDYDKAYDVGLQAYTYGLPLLVTNATFLSMTSINATNGHGYGPVNQFNSVRSLNDPSSTAVVAPGASGLSSIAWLDLTSEAQVLHVPEVKDHSFVLALLDPYTEDLRNLGSAHATPPGDYVISAPGNTVKLPAGTQQIKVDYDRIWIIGSTQLNGPDDVKTVNAIQDGYTLTPLSRYGTAYTPPAPARKDTTVDQHAVPTGLEFLDTLGQLLEQFPPPAADQAQLATFATVGIGPGRTPSTDTALSADTVRGLEAAITAGPAQVQSDTTSIATASAKKHNSYFLGGFGTYGTDYQLRAVVAVMGLGAFTSDQTIFASTLTDGTGTALDGSSSYTMHLTAAPPTREGWTVTVYDTKGALVPNAINRYNLSSASALTKNADGSVDIVVQATQPADPAQAKNWLPVASGQGFEVIWRLMAPQPDAIDGILDGSGWQPASIALAGSTTAAGPAPDYSNPATWLSLPTAPTKGVDVFYLSDTTYSKATSSSPNVGPIDDPAMQAGAKKKLATTGAAFETVGNIYAPYNRQVDATYKSTLSIPDQLSLEAGVPTSDAVAAFDYYIAHLNQGRPFILAGHSQGSNLVANLLSGYLKQHPALYERMVAAYAIGFSITGDYLAQNPQLKFATGPDDTGVVISYNTEAPVLQVTNPVTMPGGIAINPVTWTRSQAAASALQGLGGISIDPTTGAPVVDAAGAPVVVHDADAQVSTQRGVLVCSTADPSTLAPGVKPVAAGIYHSFDYAFYFFDLRANAQNRVDRFLSRR